ncbi:MAG: crossover junction endodeoxyribonuclease RuvC, partial [Oscillospiraceae bacterium]
KHQVQEMVKNILNLKEIPKPDDTADAVALAICHGHSSGSQLSRLIARAEEKNGGMGKILHKK